jgi:serine-type D-Ala-D-Ala carboxypeptidase (penicillin-binding protein 5/6)
MINALILTFILPFVPAFFYPKITSVFPVKSVPLAKVEACSAGSENVCGLVEGVASNSEDKAAVSNEEKKDLKSGNDIFPSENYNRLENVPKKNTNSADIKIWAGSSVAIDADTGTILHYDEGKKRVQIASLTKMMTATLVLENIKDLNEEVIIPREALQVAGTVVGCPTSGVCVSNRLYTGEKIKTVDLLKAMLMNSANDAATALGIHVAGSTEKFVQRMNDKAKEMGLKDTNFCTPSGLEIDGRESECYSTAYDIARIAAYSLKYDKIWEIMRTPEDKIYSCSGNYMHQLKNTDILLSSLANCLGGKTGFTPLSGRSLMMGFMDSSDQHKIIAVILNDENRWDDMKKLTDWVVKNYTWE